MEPQESLIYIDDLTGLLNRRYLFAQLPKELEAVKASNHKLWLFMLDIDDFKIINDTYGHLSGDEIIKDVSVILKENTKAEDKRIRYAGDEFTLILPGIEDKDVTAIAQRLVEKIDAHRFKEKHSGKEIHLTLSVGIAGFPKDASDPIELINLADKALYISKQKGKNCISTVSEITPELFWKKGLLERFPCAVLAGRDKEFSALNNALKRAAQSTTSFFLVSGELGIGKSRLLGEFERSLKPQSAVSLYARCEDKFISQPFFALGESLDAYLITLDKLPQELLEGISERERLALANFMPSLKDIVLEQPKEEQKQQDEDLAKALIKFLVNLSKKTLACLIFDDLHYIDKQSLDAIFSLIQENQRSCILVVAAFSSDELTIPEIGEAPLAASIETDAFQKSVEKLPLSSLTQEAVREMVCNILIDIPFSAELSTLIYRKTKGNPLFVEELLKYLIEKEFIYYKEGKWRQKEINEDSLPSSIEEAIKSRLDDLDEETKEMIAKAAVIGEDFQVDLLQKIDSEDKGYILDLIEAAKKTGLIYEKGVRGKDEFSFVTSEIRNILFKAIGGERKRHFYSRLGEIKEKLYPDKLNSIAGELYYNFKKAEDQVRAEQYARIVKEGRAALYDRTLKYAQALLEESVEEKMLLPLGKKAWGFVPALIRSIYIANVNYILYPAQSKMRLQSVEEVYKNLTEIFAEADILNVAVVESNIIVNNKKIGKELASLFSDSFISVLRNANIESIAFYKGIDLEELTVLIGIMSEPQTQEESISELLNKENVTHIQINELSYDISKKKSKEKESLQEIMLIDYLLGKLPSSERAEDLSQTISTHANEIAQALEQLGEQASKDSGKDKEMVKAEIMAKSIQKIGKQFLDKGEDWAKYKSGLAKTLLSMESRLRASIFSSQLEPDTKEKEKIDIMKEISLELPDDIIIDALNQQYLQKDTTVLKMKNMVERFLSTPEKKEKLIPRLKEKLKQIGASDEECAWIFEEHAWDKLTLEEKAKKLLELPLKNLARLLPMVRVAMLIKELLANGQDEQIEAIADRFIQLLEEEHISKEIFVSNFKAILELLIQDSPQKLLPKFIKKLLNFSKALDENLTVFFLIVNPFLERIIEVFLKSERIALIGEVLAAYAKAPKNLQVYSKTLEPVTVTLVEEFVRRIDLNLDWAQLLEPLILLKEQAAGLLIDKALFESGVPEGKYFEAYLRRRTIGKILEQLPRETVVNLLTKEKFSTQAPYVVKNLIEVVGAMGNEEVVEILEAPLENPQPAIRRKVIFTLSKMKGKESANILAKALKDSDATLRKEAMRALKNRKDEFAGEMLKAALEDKDLADDVRE